MHSVQKLNIWYSSEIETSLGWKELTMITIYCSFFPQKNSTTARKFLEVYGAKFGFYIKGWLKESPGETVNLLTNVVIGADQRFSQCGEGVELFFGIHANPPRIAQLGADQLYDELVATLSGSGFSQLGVQIVYVSGLHHERPEVHRTPRPSGTLRE